MSNSDSDIGSPRHPAHGLIFGSSSEQYLINEVSLSASSSDRSARARNLAEVADNLFNNHRFARAVPTFPCDGDLVGNVYGTSANASKHWSALDKHERARGYPLDGYQNFVCLRTFSSIFLRNASNILS